MLGATAQDLGISRSISQMNELEKRMLIILTLINQMRNSGAMNDFARTIEQPSNQLRILQEQLIEVGRWIGSVFYGVIGQVLPYINGFVMAIKELIKQFALFVGYEVPNSSGETKTILDQLGDSTEDVNSGIKDTGGNIDKNIKKAKEWKNVLMSFDVANVLPSQSDTNTNSNKNKVSGTGGMTVDPKILDALKNYDYIFGNVRMKATQIRDTLLKWADIAKKAFKNEIFVPLQNSWNKYGPSIEKKFSKAFDNMKTIASGIFNVVEEKWRPFFQTASDLFFSLVDTASYVFDAVSSLLKDVWNIGGKVLLEGIFDLMTGLLDLAKSINDNFVKPLIPLLKDTLGTLLSTTLGTLFNLVGRLISILGKLVTVFSKNKTAVRIFSTTMGVMWGVMKVGNVVRFWNSFKDGTTTIQKITRLFVEHTKIGEKLFIKYVNGETKFKNLRQAWKGGVNVIKLLFTNMAQATTKFKAYDLAMKSGKYSTEGLTLSQKICAGATKLLKGALTFLSNHPLVAVVTAIGLVVTALGIFSKKQKESKRSIEDCSQEIQDQYNDMKDLTQATKDAIDSAKDSIGETEGKISLFGKLRGQLEGLVDEKGYVKNMESAKILMDEINNIMPDTVKLTKDGKIQWQKSDKEINKNIESMRKLAKQQAYQETYVEAIKNQIKAEQKLNAQKEKQKELLDKATRMYEEYCKIQKEQGKEISITKDQWLEMNDELQEQNTLVEKSQEEVNKQKGCVEDLGKELDSLAGVTSDVNKETKELKETTKEAYKNLSKNGRENVAKTIKSLDEYGKKMNKIGKNNKKLSKEEVKEIKKTRTKLIKQYKLMVKDHGLKYDDILDLIQSQGVKLSSEEEAILKDICDAYESGGEESGDEFVTNLLEQIKSSKTGLIGAISDNITDMNDVISDKPINVKTEVESAVSKAQKVISNATNAIKDNPVKIKSSVASIVTKAQNMVIEAGKKVGSIKVQAKVSANQESLEKAIKDIKKGFEKGLNLSHKLVLSEKGKKQEQDIAWLKIKQGKQPKLYATGGFPNVGQMFIARENGIPELVGSMGGKNAVANNMQIEAGIEAAAYNGFIRAIREAGGLVSQGRNGDLHVYIQDENGRTRIEKIIKDYNNYMTSTGGKGGFKV